MKRFKQSKWLLLALLALAQFMVVLDMSVVNVALPALKNALHFSDNALPWVVTAYTLTFGGFLMLGGRAADLFGRRRVLMTGLLGFTLTSLLIGLSTNAPMLVGLRALQGLGAALMAPAALSIVLTTYRETKDRTTALSAWALITAGGAAMGMLIGGLLTEYANWRWNFFINVPVGILTTLAIMNIVPKHESEAAHRDLDLPGAVLVTGGLMTLVYALTQTTSWGWTNGKTLGLGLLSAMLLSGFVANESRSKHPLIPLRIFKNRNVSGANIMMAPVYAGVMGSYFLASLYIQTVLHSSPVMTGLSFLPFPVVLALTAMQMRKLLPKYGFKPFLIIGPLLAAAGLAWMTRLSVDGSYLVNLLPAFLVMPVGMGMTMVSLNMAATSGVAPTEAGLASGLINTSQQMGGALGLAVLSGVAASGATAAAHLGPLVAMTHGDTQAFAASVGFMLLAVLTAATIIRGKHQSAETTAPAPRGIPEPVTR